MRWWTGWKWRVNQPEAPVCVGGLYIRHGEPAARPVQAVLRQHDAVLAVRQGRGEVTLLGEGGWWGGPGVVMTFVNVMMMMMMITMMMTMPTITWWCCQAEWSLSQAAMVGPRLLSLGSTRYTLLDISISTSPSLLGFYFLLHICGVHSSIVCKAPQSPKPAPICAQVFGCKHHYSGEGLGHRPLSYRVE